MTISSVSLASSASAPAASQDSQVQALKAKIDDWANCPTTDASTKKSIVTQLTTQLDSLTALIESKAKTKAVDKPPTTSVGRLDILA